MKLNNFTKGEMVMNINRCSRIVMIAIFIGLNGLQDPPTVSANDVRVTEINMVSTPDSSNTYRHGETIEFKVTFNTAVEVSGHVVMGMWVGNNWRGATYRRGSGTRNLVFGYEVKITDSDSNGVSVHSGYIDSNGRQHGIGGSGTIKAVGRNVEVSPAYRGIPNQANHKVDGRPWVTKLEIVSTPASNHTYRNEETMRIDLIFSAPVRIDSTSPKRPFITVIVGTDQRNFLYSSGSRTDTLRFARTVRPSYKDDDGFRIFSAYPGDERVVWARDHDVRAKYEYRGFEAGNRHKVDGRPYIKNVAITSRPNTSNTYRRNETIQLTFTFDQTVMVDGTVTKDLRFDGGRYQLTNISAKDRYAEYASGNQTKELVFEYTVQRNDFDPDGLTVKTGTATSGWSGSGSIWSWRSYVNEYGYQGTVSKEGKFDPSHTRILGARNHKVNGRLNGSSNAIAALPSDLSTDFNGNGVIDFPDFLLFADVFGLKKGQEGYEAKYDLDGDGQIGSSDFLIFLDTFGKGEKRNVRAQ